MSDELLPTECACDTCVYKETDFSNPPCCDCANIVGYSGPQMSHWKWDGKDNDNVTIH